MQNDYRTPHINTYNVADAALCISMNWDKHTLTVDDDTAIPQLQLTLEHLSSEHRVVHETITTPLLYGYNCIMQANVDLTYDPHLRTIILHILRSIDVTNDK